MQDLSPLAQGFGTKSESRSVIGQLIPFLGSYWSKMTQFSTQFHSSQSKSQSSSRNHHQPLSNRSSPDNNKSRKSKENSPSKNAPIGLNSLSKTFNIIKIVGQGNFGRVFKLENKFDHRLFALKQILITPKEDLKKVLQEVENLSRAGKHKNIVKYLDCFLIQEENHDEICEEEESDPSSVSEYTETTSDRRESISFINFEDDVSDVKQILVSGDQKENFRFSNKSLSLSDPATTDCILGYSRTITCICIKVFCLLKYLNSRTHRFHVLI